MSLRDWADNGWLKEHQTDREEIASLRAIVLRDLADAENATLSLDWRFGIAYNAALKLCTMALYAQGYRPANALAHYRTVWALKEMPGENWSPHAAYLDASRMRRNTLEYDHVGGVTDTDVQELLAFSHSFQLEVEEYLRKNFPDLL